MTEWLNWAPLAAACCHTFEEFAWPGGFVEWYQRYRADGTRMTPKALVIMHVLLLAACLNYALLADTRLGATALLGLCALLCSNGLWHAWASVKSHTVSPGLVTGILLYVPLLIVQFNVYLQARRVSLWGAVVAAGVGGSYHVWSAVYHKVGARKRNGVDAVSLIGAK